MPLRGSKRELLPNGLLTTLFDRLILGVMQKFTIAIISNTDAGIILASQLEKDGHSTLIVDTDDSFSIETPVRFTALPFIAATPENKTDLEKLFALLNADFSLHQEELPPLTIEDGSEKPFVGFGNTTSNAVEALSAFHRSDQILVEPALPGKIFELRKSLKARVFKFSEINQFVLSSTDSRIEKLIINGNQDVYADFFIFLNSAEEFMHAFPSSYLNARTRGRISKTVSWARLTLEIEQSQPLETKKNLFFLSPNQAEHNPIVGLCLGPQNQTRVGSENAFCSIWETYVPSDLVDDTDYISNQIKSMRKLIRKAFPQIAKDSQEFITLESDTFADFSWLSEQKDVLQMPENIMLSPTLANPNRGIMQRISSAFQTHAIWLKKNSKNELNISIEQPNASDISI